MSLIFNSARLTKVKTINIKKLVDLANVTIGNQIAITIMSTVTNSVDTNGVRVMGLIRAKIEGNHY